MHGKTSWYIKKTSWKWTRRTPCKKTWGKKTSLWKTVTSLACREVICDAAWMSNDAIRLTHAVQGCQQISGQYSCTSCPCWRIAQTLPQGMVLKFPCEKQVTVNISLWCWQIYDFGSTWNLNSTTVSTLKHVCSEQSRDTHIRSVQWRTYNTLSIFTNKFLIYTNYRISSIDIFSQALKVTGFKHIH